MKKLIAALFFLSTIVVANAQNTEGVVTFEEKVNLHRRMQDDQMKAMVPEFRSSTMLLYFKGDESLYKADESDDDEEANNAAAGGGGGGPQVRFQRPNSEIYRNAATQRSVEQRDMRGKKFLIEDTLAQQPWKLTTETKVVAKYNCTKATYNDTARKQDIVAWFTMDLPTATGPQSLGGLPGMILEVDINKGETIIAAKKIEFKKVKPANIAAPTKGDKMTRAEFRKQMEEFRKQMGGGAGRPNIMIRN